MNSPFDFQPVLHGEDLSLQPLAEPDFPALLECAKALDTWKDYPNPTVRLSGDIRGWFSKGIEDAKALLICRNHQIIGTTRYYALPDQSDGIGIGYTFITAAARNQGLTNRNVKSLMFAHAFATFDAVWFHVLPDNLRSQAAVQKLDVKDRGEETLNLTGKPLVYKTYVLERSVWEAQSKFVA